MVELNGEQLLSETCFFDDGKHPTKELRMKNIFDVEDIIEEKRLHSTLNFKWDECSIYVQEWAYLGITCILSTVWLKMSTTLNGTKIIGNDADDKLYNHFSDIKNNSQKQACPE